MPKGIGYASKKVPKGRKQLAYFKHKTESPNRDTPGGADKMGRRFKSK